MSIPFAWDMFNFLFEKKKLKPKNQEEFVLILLATIDFHAFYREIEYNYKSKDRL